MSISGNRDKGFGRQFGKPAEITVICPVTQLFKLSASVMQKSLGHKKERKRTLRLLGLLFQGQVESIFSWPSLGP